MTNLQITSLHHVQLAIPKGAEDQARGFYIGVLGMHEVEKPAELRGRGGCWFESGTVALHLGVEEPFVPAKKAHPALVVPEIHAAHALLADLGATEISKLPGLSRFYIADPFGNRIEIVAPDPA